PFQNLRRELGIELLQNHAASAEFRVVAESNRERQRQVAQRVRGLGYGQPVEDVRDVGVAELQQLRRQPRWLVLERSTEMFSELLDGRHAPSCPDARCTSGRRV